VDGLLLVGQMAQRSERRSREGACLVVSYDKGSCCEMTKGHDRVSDLGHYESNRVIIAFYTNSTLNIVP